MNLQYFIPYFILLAVFGPLTLQAQNCEPYSDTLVYKIEIRQNKKITISPRPENCTELAYIASEFDLNGDGINELLIDIGVCGNNVCVSAIYSPDAQGNYRCILQPDYWWKIECGIAKTNGWKDLIIYAEPYYRFAGEESNLTLIEFVEPSPYHYVFDRKKFVKSETI